MLTHKTPNQKEHKPFASHPDQKDVAAATINNLINGTDKINL